MVVCAWCGAVPDDGQPPLTWTSSVKSGTVRYYCERCSREHLRSIEGRLDAAWW